MKKTLLFLLALAFAGSVSALDNAGGITNWKAQKDSNGDVVLKVINTSPSGTPIPTPAPGGNNVVLNGISGVAATSYFDKLTTPAQVNQGTAGSAPWPVTVSAVSAQVLASLVPSYATLSSTAVTLNATAAIAVNLTHVAGVSVDGLIPYWSSEAVNVHWNYGVGGATPSFWHLTAVSTTATLDERAAIGEVLYFKSVTGDGPLNLTVRRPAATPTPGP